VWGSSGVPGAETGEEERNAAGGSRPRLGEVVGCPLLSPLPGTGREEAAKNLLLLLLLVLLLMLSLKRRRGPPRVRRVRGREKAARAVIVERNAGVGERVFLAAVQVRVYL
jgi:hypothetical protein